MLIKFRDLSEKDQEVIEANKIIHRYPSGVVFGGFFKSEVSTSRGVVKCCFTRDYDPSDPLYDSYSIRYELIK